MSEGLWTLRSKFSSLASSVRKSLSETGSSPTLSTISSVSRWSSLEAASFIVRNNWLFSSWKNLKEGEGELSEQVRGEGRERGATKGERGRGEGAREGRRGKEKAVVKGILAHTRPIGWL